MKPWFLLNCHLLRQLASLKKQTVTSPWQTSTPEKLRCHHHATALLTPGRSQWMDREWAFFGWIPFKKNGIDHLPTVKQVVFFRNPQMVFVYLWYIYICVYKLYQCIMYIYISHIYIHIFLNICIYIYSIYTHFGFGGSCTLLSCLLCSNESYDELIVYYSESKHFMLFEFSCIHFAAERRNSRSLWVILDGSWYLVT